MNYFLQLGREPALALSEVLFLGEAADIPIQVEWVRDALALVSCDAPPPFLDCDVLGGTIKVIEPVGIVEGDVVESIAGLLAQHSPEGKIIFGLNGWFGADVDDIARSVKSTLRASDRVVRYVRGSNGMLDAATVIHNNLLSSGGDIHVIQEDDRVLLARTMSVQDVDAWSQRDYEKPVRDARRGMLPPKLARMMVNMSGLYGNGTVFDPFCGMGTVLIEAALLGYTTVGSDADPRAVEGAKQNIDWLRTLYDIPDIEVLQADARSVAKRISQQINSIVTETFLGNPNVLTHTQREEHAITLADLYIDSLKNWRSLLPSGARVVMAIPLYQTKKGYVRVPLFARLKQVGYERIAPPISPDHVDDEFSPDGNLLYGRAGQRVLREIIILERI